MGNLFQISVEMQSIMNELIENDGELTPELEQMLTIAESNLREKSSNYAYVVRSLEYDNDIIDSEIKRLQGLKKTRTNAIDRLKNALTNAMIICDVSEITTATTKISFRKSEVLEIVDETKVPKKYKTNVVTTKIDKNEIKSDLKAGKRINGVELIQKQNIQIK